MTHCHDDPVLPFGKRYRGRRLSHIPASYLRGLYADGTEETRQNPDGWLTHPLRRQIKEELIRRGLPFGKFKGTPLTDLDQGYLRWLTSNVELLPPLDVLVRELIGEHERQRARLHEERATRRGETPSARMRKRKAVNKQRPARRER